MATPDDREHNPDCLGCGSRNPSSLGFRLEHLDAESLRAHVAFGVHHEGAPGRTHGGALATALDEGLGQLAQEAFGGDCLTAELRIRYAAPVASGDVCAVHARVERREGRKLWVTGEVRRGDVVHATASGLWLEPRPPADA